VSSSVLSTAECLVGQWSRSLHCWLLTYWRTLTVDFHSVPRLCPWAQWKDILSVKKTVQFILRRSVLRRKKKWVNW